MKALHFDPRTKLMLMIICVLSATLSPALHYEAGLILLIMLFGLVCGKPRYSLLCAFCYGVIFALTLFTRDMLTGTVRTMLIAFLGLVHKVYPCSMMAGLMISTTKVSEFMAAMMRIHVPKKIIIPLAVLLRYLPVIREDWGFIKDAMRMRDVSPSFKGLLTQPAMTAECVYVPLMMSASKAADELSIASVTRGIENPKPRTCLTQIRFRTADVLAACGFLGYFIAGLYLRGVAG